MMMIILIFLIYTLHIDIDDSLICEQLAQFIMFMIQVDPLNCDNDRPILSYPKVIQSGRVYPWYLIPSISRLCEIRPLVEEQIKKK